MKNVSQDISDMKALYEEDHDALQVLLNGSECTAELVEDIAGRLNARRPDMLSLLDFAKDMLQSAMKDRTGIESGGAAGKQTKKPVQVS